MDKLKKQIKISVEEYLRGEETAKVRHEYVDGEVFEMAGGTLAHNTITLNIATSLRSRLKGSDCKVYMEAVRVQISSINSFYYPDVIVDCCYSDQSRVYTETPVIIFEVLSRATALVDRREKLIAYKRISSLKAYILVHQARRCAEIFRKHEEDVWSVQVLKSGDDVLLPTPGDGIKMTVNDLYEDLDLENSPDLQVQEDVEDYVFVNM